MTWAASIHPTPAGLVLRWDRPVRVLEMTRDEARELAALLLVAAELEGDERNETR